MKRNIRANLLQLSLIILLACITSVQAGTFRDDFDSATLNTDVWEVVKTGNAAASVKDGQLILESSEVPAGIIIYFKQKIEDDFVVECKIDTTNEDPGSLGTVGFTDGIFAPEPSPDFWVHWLGHCNIGPTVSTPLTDNYPAKNSWATSGDTVNFAAGTHVWKFEMAGNKLTQYIDGEAVGESDAADGPDRYFHISPDTYTSHYLGTLAVDYVEITSDSLDVTAVSSAGKLTSGWGAVKKGL